jgi:hypothetical protein
MFRYKTSCEHPPTLNEWRIKDEDRSVTGWRQDKMGVIEGDAIRETE